MAAEGAAVSSAAPLFAAGKAGATAEPGPTHRVTLRTAVREDLSAAWELRVNASEGWTLLSGQRQALASPGVAGPAAAEASYTLDLKRGASAEADWLVLDVGAYDLDRVKDPRHWRVYFRATTAGLEQTDVDTYRALALGITPDGRSTVPQGRVVAGPPELQGLAPWDNPNLPPAVRVETRALYEASLAAAELATTTGALTASGAVPAAPSEDDAAAPVQAGCAGGALPFEVLAILGAAGVLVWTSRRRGTKLVLMAAVALPTLPTRDASAVTRGVWGYVQYWDIRDMSDAPGSRLPTCNASLTTCMPSEATCCFSGVPLAKIRLYKKTGPGAYQAVGAALETSSSSPGLFVVQDTDWHSGDLYALYVTYQHTGWPATYSIRSDSGEFPVWSYTPDFAMSETSTWLAYSYYLDNAGQTTGDAGDLGAVWTSLYDSFLALEAEGETRHRNTAQNNNDPDTYDPIEVRYACWTDYCQRTECNTNRIYLANGNAREDVPSRYFGLLYIGRVMGCSGAKPAYPTLPVTAREVATLFDSDDRPEGYGLTAGLADLVPLLMHWNPNTADVMDVLTDYHDCDITTHSNTNFASAARNNQLALWEFLDTSTANPFPFYTDSVDLTPVDLMDSLFTLKNANGNPGANRTNNQQWFSATTTARGNTDACTNGAVCLGYGSAARCYVGDVHGENIYDWMYHVALDQGASTTTYRTTLSSSLCMTGYDNSHPYSYGYRED